MIDFERARILRLRRRAVAVGLDLLATRQGGLRLYSPDRREYLGTGGPSRRPQRLSVEDVELLLSTREQALTPI